MLHREPWESILLAIVVDRDKVWVVQQRPEPRLSFEAGPHLGVGISERPAHDLQGDLLSEAPGPLKTGEEDAPHSALAQQRQQLEAVSVALDTDQVELISVQLTPLEGPPALPEATAWNAPVYEVRKWRSKDGCSASYGIDDVEITVLMLDVDDNTIDTVTTSVSEAPATAYKRNGGGYGSGSATTVKGSTIDLNP